jgi:hypothetical protein
VACYCELQNSLSFVKISQFLFFEIVKRGSTIQQPDTHTHGQTDRQGSQEAQKQYGDLLTVILFPKTRKCANRQGK